MEGAIFSFYCSRCSSTPLAQQQGLQTALLPPSCLSSSCLSTSLPPVSCTDTAPLSDPVLATYVTLCLSVISCLSSLPVCPSQTGRSPRWPCCWGERPSPSWPSFRRSSRCASAPGVAATGPWRSYSSLQVRDG